MVQGTFGASVMVNAWTNALMIICQVSLAGAVSINTTMMQGQEIQQSLKRMPLLAGRYFMRPWARSKEKQHSRFRVLRFDGVGWADIH